MPIIPTTPTLSEARKSTDHILVTGASGFVGRQVATALAASGYRITALSRRPAHGLPDGVEFLACDLQDPKATAALVCKLAPSHLVHAAWCVTPGRFWTDPANLDWVAASLLLFRAFAAAGGKRAVFVGTCAEYDWCYPTLVENVTPIAPATLYGVAKHSLHVLVDALACQLGVSLAWARLFLTFGPHEMPNRLVSELCQNLLDGRSMVIRNGTQHRDFMHVADAGGAVAALVRSATVGPINIASGRTATVRHVAERIGVVTGRPDLIDFGPGGTPVDGPEILAANITRLRAEVGFTPRFDLDGGLTDTVDWWRSQRRR